MMIAEHRPSAAVAAVALGLAFVLSACGSVSGPPTTAPQAVGSPTTAPPVVGSSAGPDASDAAAASMAPAPSVAPAPALDLAWEHAGNPPAQGSIPATYWPAIDPKTGNIWVAVPFSGLFWIFGPDGKTVGSFGGPGTGPGQFNFQRPCKNCGAGAIAFAPDGSFFVADDGNNRIQKFDPQHHFVTSWGTFGSGNGQFADANSIATDGKVVYVYDDSRTDTQVFDTSGTYQRTLKDLYGWMLVGRNGHLFAASSAGIVEVDAEGKTLNTWSLPQFEGDRIGLAMDPGGRFYFNIQDHSTADALGLVRFDPATNAVERWSTAGETLLVDPTGKAIYEANYVSAGWPSATLRKYTLPAS